MNKGVSVTPLNLLTVANAFLVTGTGICRLVLCEEVRASRGEDSSARV